MAGIIRASANQMLTLTKGLLPEPGVPDEEGQATTLSVEPRPGAEELAEMRRLLDLGALSDIAE